MFIKIGDSLFNLDGVERIASSKSTSVEGDCVVKLFDRDNRTIKTYATSEEGFRALESALTSKFVAVRSDDFALVRIVENPGANLAGLAPREMPVIGFRVYADGRLSEPVTLDGFDPATDLDEGERWAIRFPDGKCWEPARGEAGHFDSPEFFCDAVARSLFKATKRLKAV